jgi:hypothetical protein
MPSLHNNVTLSALPTYKRKLRERKVLPSSRISCQLFAIGDLHPYDDFSRFTGDMCRLLGPPFCSPAPPLIEDHPLPPVLPCIVSTFGTCSCHLASAAMILPLLTLITQPLAPKLDDAWKAASVFAQPCAGVVALVRGSPVENLKWCRCGCLFCRSG